MRSLHTFTFEMSRKGSVQAYYTPFYSPPASSKVFFEPIRLKNDANFYVKLTNEGGSPLSLFLSLSLPLFFGLPPFRM